VAKLRIACIGAWGHWDSVLRELDHFPDPRVELVALAKALPDEDFTDFRKHPSAATAPVFEDYRRMLREVEPDVAVISTRLDLIASLAIEAAEAGCHLICKKPLALTHEGLAELASAMRANGVQCVAMLGNRVHPVLAAAKKLVDEGVIGEVVLANARKSYKWGERPEWFGKRAIYGGTIGWVGIHGLDFIHTVTGQDFVQVAAMQSNKLHPERPECEDNAVLMLKLANGGHATLSMDYLRPAAAATHGNDYLRVVGSKGAMEADMSNGRLIVTTQDQPQREIATAPTGPFYAEFYEHLLQGKTDPMPDMRKAFYLTHVALCARDSADEQRMFDVRSTTR